MTGKQPATPTDYLTRLPQETLQYICELSVDPLHPIYLGLVAKAFLPFARRRVFAKVHFGQPAALVKLATLIEASPGAGEYVQELRFILPAGQQDEGTPSTKEFLKLLGLLPALVDLKIKHATRLIKAFLSDTKNRRLLPSLKYLTLQDPFSGWTNPFDPGHFYALTRHAELRCIDLHVVRTADSLGRYRPVNLKYNPWKWQFSLDLTGPICDNPAAYDFLLFFNEIPTLKISETASSSDIASLLHAVRYLSLLRLLDLDFATPLSDQSLTELRLTLHAFTALETLVFSKNAFNTALLPGLYTLPNLKEIIFLHECGVTLNDVVELLSNSHRVPRLRDLRLSNLRYFVDSYGLDADVHEPQWTEELTDEDGQKILGMCEERSVDLGGVVGKYVKHERERERKRERRRMKELAAQREGAQQTNE